MKQACNKLGLCKSSLGQCASECKNISIGKTKGNGKGGKGAGTASSGDPFGDPNRLADSLRKSKVLNLSNSGAMVIFPVMPHIGEAVTLQLLDWGQIQGHVRWARDGKIGINFAAPLE
jgi:hypothetical protein